MGTSPTYGLPYPEQADSVDVPRDTKALALATDTALGGVRQPTASAGTLLRTLPPNVWTDMAAVDSFAVVAGRHYLLSGFGSVSVGGARAVAYHRLMLGTVQSSGPPFDVPLDIVIPVAASAALVATATGNVKATWQVFVSSPATGIIIYEGTNMSVGRFG